MEFNKEQIFIVTGANSGIGRDIAQQLNALGATVIGIARDEERLLAAKNESQHPEDFHVEVKDLTQDLDGLPKYVTSLRKKYGKLTGLACCAGVSINMSLKGIDMPYLEHNFAINYFSPIMMAKGFTDKRNNVGKGAAILAFSSIGAIACQAGMAAYAGNKSALAASMKVIAKEVVSQGVHVNTVAPSLIMTEMLDDAIVESHAGLYPLGIGEVDDVSNLSLFLLSDKAKWITGQNYVIDCASM